MVPPCAAAAEDIRLHFVHIAGHLTEFIVLPRIAEASAELAILLALFGKSWPRLMFIRYWLAGTLALSVHGRLCLRFL
jgi:hypothetical protein